MKKLLLLLLLPLSVFSQSYQHAVTLGDYKGYRYFASIDKFSFWDAESHLQSIDSSLHLLSIHSEAENLFVYYKVMQNLHDPQYPSFYWLGGHDENNEGQWEWIDGTQWDYEGWMTDTSQTTHGAEPNNLGGDEDYLMGMYYYDGKWNDATNNPSDLPFHYVFKVRLNVQDTLTVDESDVQDNSTSQDTTTFSQPQVENKIYPTYQRVELSKVVFETSWENQTTLLLHDSGGRLVHNITFTTEQRNVLELPLLSAGIYYGVMKNEGELFRFKILLTK